MVQRLMDKALQYRSKESKEQQASEIELHLLLERRKSKKRKMNYENKVLFIY